VLSDPPDDGQPLLVIATDRYVGEGYDCPRLDTLFLAHPVAFKGSMVQYVGRVLRSHPGKTEIEVHDYVDAHVGVLAAMWRKRSKSYTQLGFTAVALPDDDAPDGTSALQPGAAVALPGL
jgi:superfamily II DNA or RNA helicase